MATETNTFSPIRINRSAFEGAFYAPPGKHPSTPTLCSAPIIAARERATTENLELIEGTAAWAEPAGLLSRTGYESLRDEILGQLMEAGPLGVVLLGLHGAMAAEDYDDCEGDLLTRARAIVGPDVTIGIELDPHCHLSAAMIAATDIMVAFKEVPHDDFLDRARDLVDLCIRCARCEIAPVTTVLDCRSIANFITSREPGRSLIDDIIAQERQNGVLNISIIHGFPAADVYDAGTKVVVITDADPQRGRDIAADVAERILNFGEDRLPPMPAPEEALSRAAALPGRPIILADRWDNPGGGVAGDSTFLLRACLARPDIEAALGALWDPIAVSLCYAAGIGASFDLRFGGKSGPGAGAPVDARVTVTGLCGNLEVPFAESRVSLGTAAAVRTANLDVVLASKRVQTFHPEVFERMGIRLAVKKAVAVKSASHFHTAFAPIAADIIYVNCGGPYPPDPARIPYTKIRRPIAPLEPAEPIWM